MKQGKKTSMAHVDVINNALQLELNLFLIKIIEIRRHYSLLVLNLYSYVGNHVNFYQQQFS